MGRTCQNTAQASTGSFRRTIVPVRMGSSPWSRKTRYWNQRPARHLMQKSLRQHEIWTSIARQSVGKWIDHVHTHLLTCREGAVAPTNHLRSQRPRAQKEQSIPKLSKPPSSRPLHPSPTVFAHGCPFATEAMFASVVVAMAARASWVRNA